MKLIDQINARQVLLNHADDKPPIQLAYKIAVIISESEKDYNFYRDKMNEIIEECGMRSEDGKFVFAPDNNSVIIQNGMIEECNRRIAELKETEICEPKIKFTIEELSSIQFSINELLKLNCYIQ